MRLTIGDAAAAQHLHHNHDAPFRFFDSTCHILDSAWPAPESSSQAQCCTPQSAVCISTLFPPAWEAHCPRARPAPCQRSMSTRVVGGHFMARAAEPERI
jgi:hypothetical protein